MKRAQSSANLESMGPEEFLEWEREQPSDRHIYIDGEIITVRGATARHNALTAQAIVILARLVAGSACRAFASQMRVELPTNKFVYPDAVVVCGALEFRRGTDDVLVNPTLVLEVLSRSTESIDRGVKQTGYLALSSLRHYVLVAQRSARVEVYSRLDDGAFRREIFESGASVPLDGIHGKLEVDELYRGAFDLPGR